MVHSAISFRVHARGLLALRLASRSLQLAQRLALCSARPDFFSPLLGGRRRQQMRRRVGRHALHGGEARHALELAFSAQPPHSLLTSTVSACGTRKLLLRLRRGDEVEAR